MRRYMRRYGDPRTAPGRQKRRARTIARDYLRRYYGIEAQARRRPRAQVADLDAPRYARACLHGFFTAEPCRRPAVLVGRAGDRWCGLHGRGKTDLRPLPGS